MNRSEAAQEVKSRYAEYLRPARKKVNGEPSYICPLCDNGMGSDGDGMAIIPKGKNPYTLHCFKCGFTGSIVDLYQKEHNCSVGDAFRALYDFFGITIDDEAARKPAESKNEDKSTNMPVKQQNATEGQIEAVDRKPDYMDYYDKCIPHRPDPAAQAYLSLRGISSETAAAHIIGYDPDTQHIIIPISPYFYVARSTDPAAERRYKNPAGASVELFNTQALYNAAGRPVFITESAFDALSIIEAGCEAVGLNSISNTRKLLLQLEGRPAKGVIVLSLDNDDAGRKATAELAESLSEHNILYTVANISGQDKDPNEALTSDRAAFVEVVTTTEKRIRYPGLLTSARAIKILEDADDNHLEMPSFPQLSLMAKIKTHDTVVIAADTGAGKSSLALNVLHDLHDRYPALYINLEMDEATILQRLVSIHTGMELDRVEGYKQDNKTREEVNAALMEITAGREIQLLEDVYDLNDIEKLIKATTRGRTEPTMVFIDTGLLVTTTNKTGSRYERFTMISEELRRISRLNNIIMFVLLQQNREGKKEEKKEPTNSSLKESGSWENDATKIIFLWNNPETDSKELVITKNRGGISGKIKLSYTPHTQTYKEAKDGFEAYDDPTPWDMVMRK